MLRQESNIWNSKSEVIIVSTQKLHDGVLQECSTFLRFRSRNVPEVLLLRLTVAETHIHIKLINTTQQNQIIFSKYLNIFISCIICYTHGTKCEHL